MIKTVISHFYNEEYLLPWWLNHHKQIFDHGIMINYASTDNSVEIIKSICPSWEVIDSRNSEFGAEAVDSEVSGIEATVDGWKIALNTTEFIIGDFSVLNDNFTRHEIPVSVMVDSEPENLPDVTKSLILQKSHGIHYKEGGFVIRKGRLIHREPFVTYTPGRHVGISTISLMILWYGWSPFNDNLIKRKLQIQHRIPMIDRSRGFGAEHITDIDNLKNQYNKYLLQSRDLSHDIFPLLNYIT